MKKVISVVLLLGTLFWGYQLLFSKVFDDDTLVYSVRNHDGLLADIVQEQISNNKYKIEIYLDTLVYKTNVDFDNAENNRLVTDFYYYDNDSMKCVYPTIKNISNDVLCYIDGDQVNYVDIKHKSENVKSFINDLVNRGFKYSGW